MLRYNLCFEQAFQDSMMQVLQYERKFMTKTEDIQSSTFLPSTPLSLTRFVLRGRQFST